MVNGSGWKKNSDYDDDDDKKLDQIKWTEWIVEFFLDNEKNFIFFFCKLWTIFFFVHLMIIIKNFTFLQSWLQFVIIYDGGGGGGGFIKSLAIMVYWW